MKRLMIVTTATVITTTTTSVWFQCKMNISKIMLTCYAHIHAFKNSQLKSLGTRNYQ